MKTEHERKAPVETLEQEERKNTKSNRLPTAKMNRERKKEFSTSNQKKRGNNSRAKRTYEKGLRGEMS